MGCFPITANINSCGVTDVNFTFEQDALIGNWDDIASFTRNSSNPLLINSLVLKASAKMYTVIFKEDKPMDTLAETTEDKVYAKPSKVEGDIVVYGKSPAAAYTKYLLSNNKIFMILKQAAKKGTSSYWVILGLESGLRPMAGNNFDKDRGGYVHKFVADTLTYPQEFLWADAGLAATEAIITELQVA